MKSTLKNIVSLMGLEINDYYDDVVTAVCDKRPFHFYIHAYYMLTDDKYGVNTMDWIDHMLDRYNVYKSCDYTPFECEVGALMDGLEGILKGSDFYDKP